MSKRYLIALFGVVFLVCIASLVATVLLVGQRASQEQTTLRTVAARLGVPPIWDAVESYLDCDLIKVGLRRQDVENRLKLIGTYTMLSDPDPDNGGITVYFDDPSVRKALSDRIYNFKNGMLIEKVKIVGLDTIRISCP